jgi:hypothetical protein
VRRTGASNPELETAHTDGRVAIQPEGIDVGVGVGVGIGVGVGVGDGVVGHRGKLVARHRPKS